MIGHGDGPGGSGRDWSEDDFFEYIRMRKTRGRRKRIGKKTLKKLIPSAIMATMNLIGVRKKSNKVTVPKYSQSPQEIKKIRNVIKIFPKSDQFGSHESSMSTCLGH